MHAEMSPCRKPSPPGSSRRAATTCWRSRATSRSPYRRAPVPGRGRRLARRVSSQVEGLALAGSDHRKAYRPEIRQGKPRDEVFVASIEPDPNVILHAGRSHWGIKNNLHLTLDVIFDKDRCKTRKDNAPLSLAITRHTALNILKAGRSNGSLRRKPSGPGAD
jgi:predicted transposase YbfD/YdcC